MFEQVAMNLVVNARDAMPHGGPLAIATRARTLAVNPTLGIEAGDYVVLEVEDAGQGMTPDVVAQAFDPFFSTKPRGGGTGLGLATVYGIAKRFGGHVEIDSEPDVGTRISVYFPALAAGAAQVAETVSAEPAARNALSGTILLVEDDDAVRRAAARILRNGGYEVIVAAGPVEALDAAGGLPDPPDLLLADVAMPGISGPALALRLQERWPQVPVVFASGYADQRHALPPGSHFVSNPFDGPELLAGVAAAWKS
jgi:CheY-like chemotaxis protein